MSAASRVARFENGSLLDGTEMQSRISIRSTFIGRLLMEIENEKWKRTLSLVVDQGSEKSIEVCLSLLLWPCKVSDDYRKPPLSLL